MGDGAPQKKKSFSLLKTKKKEEARIHAFFFFFFWCRSQKKGLGTIPIRAFRSRIQKRPDCPQGRDLTLFAKHHHFAFMREISERLNHDIEPLFQTQPNGVGGLQHAYLACLDSEMLTNTMSGECWIECRIKTHKLMLGGRLRGHSVIKQLAIFATSDMIMRWLLCVCVCVCVCVCLCVYGGGEIMEKHG